MKRRKTVSVLILLLVAILMLTGLSSCKDPEPEPLTDEEALRGQWAMYQLVKEPDTGNQTGTETEAAAPSTQEKEKFTGFIIDIQYTLPGYWFRGYYEIDEPASEDDSKPVNPEEITELTEGFFIKSDRTQQEDGWFVVSTPPDEGEVMKIRYRFTDEERNTMEAEVYEEKPEPTPPAENPDTEENTDTYIMRRLNHVIKIDMDFMSVGTK